ncbi:MAG: nicotinate-nucleotide adenylyltransferase [Eubacteriales bacterium]|nr:nicotinate-nucleotide adenylyltransferase [Eubacteriales bacterium]
MEKRKVGIMGGTFDPIHVGHLILGESAFHQFNLEKVLFMPSGNPPHKLNRTGRASLEERIEMVRLAIADNPHFELSLEEAHDKGYTYTRETLERLTEEHPDTDYYFIMGADSLFSFEEWKDPQRIAQLATLVAATRYHVDTLELEGAIAHVSELFQAKVEKLSTPNMDVSSQMIRKWIARDKPIRYYVPDSVIRYIHELKLYMECEE